MKKQKSILPCLLLVLIISACSQADDSIENDYGVESRHLIESPFLSVGAIPEVIVFRENQLRPDLTKAASRRIADLRSGGEEDIFIRLKNGAGDAVDNWISESPDETPVPVDIFYTPVCGNDTLVIVLEQGVNRAVSIGTRHINALFDPSSGEWLTTFHGGEIEDTDSGKMIIDNQKLLIERLKSGITMNCPEILDPILIPEGKAEELLLR